MGKINKFIKSISVIGSVLLLGISTVPMASAQYAGTNGRIVFSSPAGYTTVRPDSTNLHILGTSVTSCFAGAPIVYNPAGTALAYVGRAVGSTDADIFSQTTRFSQVPRQLTNDPSSNDCSPYYSPDGTRIAFTRESLADGHDEVWVMNADGTNQIQLTDNINSIPGNPASSYGPVWLDANTIYVVNTYAGGGGFPGIIAINSSTPMQTTGNVIFQPADATQSVQVFDISPARNQIAFSGGTHGIYTCALAVSCGVATQIIPPGTSSVVMPESPAYSPDGTKIVFVGRASVSPPNEGEDIYIANTDGSGIARMTFNSSGYILGAYSTMQANWGINNDTFITRGDETPPDQGDIPGSDSATPGVPNTTATNAQKNSPMPWMLAGLLGMVLLGLGGFWVSRELKSRK